MLIDCEVYDAPPEPEQELPRIAVAFELLNSVINRLLGQAVLQLEGRDG